MSTLVLPKALDFQSLAEAVGVQVGCLSDLCAIDLQRLRWVHPSGVAGLAALISVLTPARELSWINVGQTPAFRYLQNMDFFRQFGAFPNEVLPASLWAILM